MSATARRIPQLDGIRGAAILLVLIWHFIVVPIQQTPQAGILARIVARAGLLTWSGVDLFFVLSGFLIGGILIDTKDSLTFFSTFYIRRAFRILPVYLLLVVVYWVSWDFAVTHQPDIRHAVGSPMPWYLYLTFTQNFWLARHTWDSIFLSLSWSLAVEEQFYLVLPTIVYQLPRRLVLPTATGIALAASMSRTLLYMHYGPSWGMSAYTLLPSRADSLMIGVICAALLRNLKFKELLIKKVWLLKAFALICISAIVVFIYRDWGMGTKPMCTLGFTLLALFYGSVLLIAMVAPEGYLGRIFRIRWLMGLGRIAYGMYLFHMIVLGAAFYIFLHHSPSMTSWLDALTTCGALIASIGLAEISWRLFESKLVRLGHRFVYERRVASRSPVPVSIAPSK